jgi:hypothetical protein
VGKTAGEDNDSDDDPSAGFFDTIKNSTQVTREEKEQQRKQMMEMRH